jgi:glutamate racemase
MTEETPIGIFDSGVGGLSIARCIRNTLQAESLIYIADQGFSPYGTKSKQEIEVRSNCVIDFLIDQGCKAIVVACNTATVNSIDKLRIKYDIPLVGVEPGVKPAALNTKTGVVGILATALTLNSDSFKELKASYSEQVNVEMEACPDLVELVEEGSFSSAEALKQIENYVVPLLDKGADHIVLGCTHFSFLIPLIEKIVKDKAVIVDTAMPVAIELKRRLLMVNLLNQAATPGGVEFWSSEVSEKTSERISTLWGQKVKVSKFYD